MNRKTPNERNLSALLFLGMFISFLQAIGGGAMLLLFREKAHLNQADETQQWAAMFFEYLLINGCVFLTLFVGVKILCRKRNISVLDSGK